MNTLQEYKTVKQLVLKVLEKYPETRDNDTLLYLQCCQELGAIDINQMKILNLSIVTCHKLRQVIQNKDGLFKPSDKAKKIRLQKQQEIKSYMANY